LKGMQLYFRLGFLFFAAFSSLTIVACESGVARSDTAAAVAAATVAPAVTLATPTATPLAEQAPPSQVAQVFARTRAIERVRYKITSAVALTQAGKLVPQNGLSAQGAENGDNRTLTLSGVMNEAGDVTTFDLIVLDGVTYLKGLNGIPGVNPAQWYRFPQELGNVTHDAPGVKSLLAQLEWQDVQNAVFQNEGSEMLDAQTCTRWLARDTKLAQGLLGIAGSARAGNQLQALDRAEFRVWTCSDGYMHRLTGLVEGHDPANPTARATVELTIELYDHDGAIEITAPENVQDFQAPASDTEPSPMPNP